MSHSAIQNMKIVSERASRIQSLKSLNPAWSFRILIALLTICALVTLLWYKFPSHASYYVYSVIIIFMYFYPKYHITWIQYFQTQAMLGYGNPAALNIRSRGLYLCCDHNRIIYFLPWELVQCVTFKKNSLMLLNNKHRVLFFTPIEKKSFINLQTRINQYIAASASRKRFNDIGTYSRKKNLFTSESQQVDEFYALRFKESYKIISAYATVFTMCCILSFPIFMPFTEIIGALVLGLIMLIITQSFWKLAYDENVKFSNIKTEYPSIYFDISRQRCLLCYCSDGSFIRARYQDIKQIIIAKHLKLIQLNGGTLIPCDKNVDLSFLGDIETKPLKNSKKWLYISNFSYILFPLFILGSYLLLAAINGLF